MRYFIIVLMNILLSYLAWLLYNHVAQFQFTIAFLGGAITAILTYCNIPGMMSKWEGAKVRD